MIDGARDEVAAISYRAALLAEADLSRPLFESNSPERQLTIPLDPRALAEGSIVFTASVGGKTLRFLWDTGSTENVLSEKAAQALGLTYSQTMRYVVLPQAFRNMLPVLLTQTIVLFQDTSLVYVLSITDFLGAASKVAQRDGRLVEMYLFAAVVYFAISCVASYGVRRLQARISIVR